MSVLLFFSFNWLEKLARNNLHLITFHYSCVHSNERVQTRPFNLNTYKINYELKSNRYSKMLLWLFHIYIYWTPSDNIASISANSLMFWHMNRLKKPKQLPVWKEKKSSRKRLKYDCCHISVKEFKKKGTACFSCHHIYTYADTHFEFDWFCFELCVWWHCFFSFFLSRHRITYSLLPFWFVIVI